MMGKARMSQYDHTRTLTNPSHVKLQNNVTLPVHCYIQCILHILMGMPILVKTQNTTVWMSAHLLIIVIKKLSILTFDLAAVRNGCNFKQQFGMVLNKKAR